MRFELACCATAMPSKVLDGRKEYALHSTPFQGVPLRRLDHRRRFSGRWLH